MEPTPEVVLKESEFADGLSAFVGILVSGLKFLRNEVD